MIRPPQALGFYPPSKSALEDMIEKLLEKAEVKKEVKWGIAPHAGYVYSGLAAATLFKNLKKSKEIVILGVDHYGIARDIALHPYEAWQTPLGEVEVSKKLEKKITEIGPQIVDSPREHSIEVQLPFLQFIWGDFKFLPVTVPSVPISRLKELGEVLKKLKAPIIASSDFSHYVPKEVAIKLDSIAIEKIIEKDAEGLIKMVYDLNITMCGYNGVAALLYSLPKKARGELFTYYTSGDITGDYTSVVGYAAIGFR